MILSIDSIKDYLYCPKLFERNYKNLEMASKRSTIDKFATYCTLQTFLWFFNHALDNKKPPSLAETRKKFGDLYVKDRTISETIFMSDKKHNRGRLLENRAVEVLNTFYETFSKDASVPILINKEYTISVNGVTVMGVIPLIRETQIRDIQMLSFYPDFLTGKSTTMPVEEDRNIETIGSSIAFRAMYGSFPDSHVCYAPYSNRYHNVKVEANSHHNFNNIVESVSKAIQSNLFYPVYNDHCINCAYRDKCLREW